MGETYGTVVAIMLSAYLMFIMPLNNMIYENRKLEQIYVVNEITYFVESIRNTGTISEQMYLELIDKISSLNEVYDIRITHYKNIYNEDKSEVLYFEEACYLEDIKEELEINKKYCFGKNEYVKITVMNDETMIACYGGSIKTEGE